MQSAIHNHKSEIPAPSDETHNFNAVTFLQNSGIKVPSIKNFKIDLDRHSFNVQLQILEQSRHVYLLTHLA